MLVKHHVWTCSLCLSWKFLTGPVPGMYCWGLSSTQCCWYAHTTLKWLPNFSCKSQFGLDNISIKIEQTSPWEIGVPKKYMYWKCFRHASEYQAIGTYDPAKETENDFMHTQGLHVTTRSHLYPLTIMNRNKLHEESCSVSRWKFSEIISESSDCSLKYLSLKEF